MARKLRIEYPGAIYHVMNRGDRGELIFVDDKDRDVFLETLDEACQKTGWQVYAWCLMANHFHLVVQTPGGNLVAGMRWLLGVYTARFNRRHHHHGHLFSGRYKALVVDGSRRNGYLKTVCDYVHLNPARAKIVPSEQKLAGFLWSSFPVYLKRPSRRPKWLEVRPLFGEYRIPRDSSAGRQQFERRMEERRVAELDGEWRTVRRGWYLGDKKFRKELLAQMKEQRTEHHYGEAARESDLEFAETIVQQELKKRKWREEDLQARRKGDAGKVKMAIRLRRETTVTVKWIAERLSMGAPGAVGNLLREQV